MSLHDVVLWTGVHTWCAGFRDGLPWWGYGDAPIGLVTKSQLWEQKLRRRRGQDPYGLLIFRKSGCGEQIGELFRIDLALASRPMTPRWRASIERMQRAHHLCRDCGREFEKRMPASTWKCWDCMEKTGDFGEPAAA
jgi:hypothetical protein